MLTQRLRRLLEAISTACSGLTPSVLDAAAIAALPDTSFLLVDQAGRLLPVTDAAGKLELAQLREAVAKISTLDPSVRLRVISRAEQLAKAAGVTIPQQTVRRREDEMSLDDRMSAVSGAVRDEYGHANGLSNSIYVYVQALYDDRAIVCKGDELWSVPYAIDENGEVTLDTAAAVQVRKQVSYTKISEGQVLALLPDDPEHLVEGETKPSGRKWGVLIIQEGMSKNRNFYRRKQLESAAPLYEMAPVYIDHTDTRSRFGRSVNDKAGFLKDVQGVLLNTREADGRETRRYALAATLVVTKDRIRKEMREAYEEGNPNLFGLSHDALCESTTVLGADGPYYDVTRIEKVDSVDLVTNAAAGGRVLRLVASDTVAHTLEGDGRMLKRMIEAITKSGNADLIKKLEALGAEPTEDQVLALYEAALKTPAPAATTATTQKTEAVAPPSTTQTTMRQVTEAEWLEVRRDSTQQFVENTINGTALHDAVKTNLKASFAKRITEAKTADQLPTREAITAEVASQVELFGKLAEAKVVLPAGPSRIEITKTRHDQIKESLDAFFDPKKPATSFKEIYVSITGDKTISGRISEATRLTESLQSTSFDQILGDSITRAMLREYALPDFAAWRGTIANVVPVNDFRTQRRMRFGGYGNLSTVNEGAPYPALSSPTDEEATYAAAKRGGTEQLTREMILNDDVGVIRRIPVRLARAAGQTLYEFVFDFLRGNPNIYDSTALAAAGHGSNLISSALSSSNLLSARLKMKNQTDMSNSKRLGIRARYLVVPNDLEELAYQLTTSEKMLADSSLAAQSDPAAPSFIRSLGIRPIVVDYWTDTNDWWVTGDVKDQDQIEIGFVGGREEPDLFVQDQPNVGSMFSNDVLTYKLRHEYGGAVVDFRPFVGGIV